MEMANRGIFLSIISFDETIDKWLLAGTAKNLGVSGSGSCQRSGRCKDLWRDPYLQFPGMEAEVDARMAGSDGSSYSRRTTSS
jgi:hypothetical protein